MVTFKLLAVLRRPKHRRYQIQSRLVRPQSRSEPFGEENNLLPLSGNRNKIRQFFKAKPSYYTDWASTAPRELKKKKTNRITTHFCTCELELLPRDYAISRHTQLAETDSMNQRDASNNDCIFFFLLAKWSLSESTRIWQPSIFSKASTSDLNLTL